MGLLLASAQELGMIETKRSQAAMSRPDLFDFDERKLVSVCFGGGFPVIGGMCLL